MISKKTSYIEKLLVVMCLPITIIFGCVVGFISALAFSVDKILGTKICKMLGIEIGYKLEEENK